MTWKNRLRYYVDQSVSNLLFVLGINDKSTKSIDNLVFKRR